MLSSGGNRVSFLKRVLLGGLPIGLVITLALTHSHFVVPTSSETAHKAPTSHLAVIPAPDPAIAAAAEQERLQAIQWNAEYAQYLANVAAEAEAAARKASTPPPAAVNVPQATPAPTSGDCWGVNQYAAYIYFRESGCRLDAVNGGGCAGIGQACPGSKLPCSLSDAPCQLAYFESYAFGRYGSWEAAYQFWLGHNWW